MELSWLDPQQPDQRDLAGAVAVLAAATAADTPSFPLPTVSGFAARLRYGFAGEPRLAAVARTGAGGDRVLGVLRLTLPRWDNTHLADVTVTVDPAYRRRGLGRALFDAGVAQVREQGRRLVCATCLDQPGPAAFLTAMGLTHAYTEALRRQDLSALDPDRFAAAEAEAEAGPGADEYELLRLPGPVPDDLLAAVVAVTGAINDAPTGELEIEDEVFTPERLRAYERAAAGCGRRLYRVVARHRPSGELAGQTVVAVDAEHPWRAGQDDTSVAAAHRGHRLGLRLKLAMLRLLAEAEPQVRELDTGNAADNAHMIRVNELLGYELYANELEWQRHL
ncbi:GNAT family N-acetyltransferase [Natronosporangium hydrolyticum]|uniref:GNAT family N-acetyltransferase n=1 Tax=Natronosporangium hydrolyticum TaxID=2811111 RepID=A0A895YHS4_9ACTN|nr:GNAT family N-acetyltransferase [Natronosporangium hydrolyticum]QSB14096.1 GNAT family N-acetyltransferase [Natronosporangium hydrolyticum]